MQVSDWSLPGSTPPITDNEDRMRWPRHPPDLPLVILQGDGDDDNKNYDIAFIILYHISFIFTHSTDHPEFNFQSSYKQKIWLLMMFIPLAMVIDLGTDGDTGP